MTVRDFNAVLGTGRGSRVAQAHRDANERNAHESALAGLIAHVDKASGGHAGHSLVDVLVSAYQHRAYTPGTDGYTALILDLESKAGARGVRELTAIVRFGDPPSWPGLTTPAVQALGHYFASPTMAGISGARHRLLRGEAEQVVLRCFVALHQRESYDKSYDESYYERLRPLCEGLGQFIACLPQPRGDRPEITRLTTQAINAFGLAPVAAISGPLQSWVGALAARAAAGNLTTLDRGLLQRLVDECASDPGFASAFAKVTQQL